MKKSMIAVLAIVLLSFVIGAYLYPQMPDRMASHWNAEGKVDGYMPKCWGLFLMPMISAGLALLFFVIPRIDPLKQNVASFRKYFDTFIVLLMLFLFYLHMLTIAWSFGFAFSMIQAMVPGFAALFFYAGIMLDHAKRNWFIGVRTPWTMSSDVVWSKTNKLGGKLFKISAVLTLIGIFFEAYAIYIMLVPILLSTVYVILYSYFEFQKQTRKKRK